MTDFYIDWLGCGAFGAVGRRAVAEVTPIVFQPTDLSSCVVWFDANNSGTITLDGTNTYVTSWSNQGTYGGLATNADTSNVVYSGTQTINALNVLDFSSNAALTFPFAKGTSDTTAFIVCQPQTDFDVTYCNINFINPVGQNGYLALGMGYDSNISFTEPYFYAQASSGYYFVTLATSSNNPWKQTANISWRSDSNALSNQILVNSSNITLSYSSNALCLNDLQTYWIGDTSYNTQFYLAEMIIYDRVLSDTDVATVNSYLTTRWNI